MLIAKIPENNPDFAKMVSMLNDGPIQGNFDEYGVNKQGVLEVVPIDNLKRPKGFNAGLLNAVFKYLPDKHKQGISLSHLCYAGELDGSVLGCYAADPHTDEDIGTFNVRWLVVLQCKKGFVFTGFNQTEQFQMTLEPGMVIEFDEDQIHDLAAPEEGIDVTVPNLFYTIAAPHQINY